MLYIECNKIIVEIVCLPLPHTMLNIRHFQYLHTIFAHDNDIIMQQTWFFCCCNFTFYCCLIDNLHTSCSCLHNKYICLYVNTHTRYGRSVQHPSYVFSNDIKETTTCTNYKQRYKNENKYKSDQMKILMLSSLFAWLILISNKIR